jgi:hypothetical protein
MGGEEQHGEDKKNRRLKKQGQRGTRSLALHYCFCFCADASPPPELLMCTSDSKNKRGGEEEENNNNNAAMQNYNQIRFLIYFLGFWCGGGICGVAKIGNRPQKEDLAKLAIIHKTKF